MDLLDKDVRDEVFLRNRPILTRIKDEAPAYYGDKALVEDSLIADGCVIEGTVKTAYCSAMLSWKRARKSPTASSWRAAASCRMPRCAM